MQLEMGIDCQEGFITLAQKLQEFLGKRVEISIRTDAGVRVVKIKTDDQTVIVPDGGKLVLKDGTLFTN